MKARVLFDVSSLVRWTGPPVGITRVERAICDYVRARRPDVVLTFYNAETAAFHTIAPPWQDTLLGWDGKIDDNRRRRGWRRCVPGRYPLMMALERLRLSVKSPRIAAIANALQRAVLALRPHQFPFSNRDGQRIAVVPIDMAIGPSIALGPSDIMLSAGSDWSHKPAAAIAALKQRHGFRYVTLCYDIIPLQFPEYYAAADVAAFTAHWQQMFALADFILCISHCVAADVQKWCASHGITPAPIEVAPLGYDPPRADAPRAPLPPGIVRGRYAMFVSTIEPRKGHAMLLRVWRRLLRDGIPQRHQFQLVFVGRPGWMVDDLLADLQREIAAGTVLHFDGLTDNEVAALYTHAAFCLYPSRYEGFGLPLIEAFAHGNAVISSNAGALPEVAAGRAPCLDPDDEPAWQNLVGKWIEDPAARAPYEARIRDAPPPDNWDTAAARILELTTTIRSSCAPAAARP